MNTKYLLTVGFKNSCHEFLLKTGPNPIFTGTAGTREFLGLYGWGGVTA